MAKMKRDISEYTPFGLKIDELCLKHSMSFHQLAAASGMKSHASIIRACQGKSTPQRENILKWCDVLHASDDECAVLLRAFHYTAD